MFVHSFTAFIHCIRFMLSLYISSNNSADELNVNFAKTAEELNQSLYLYIYIRLVNICIYTAVSSHIHTIIVHRYLEMFMYSIKSFYNIYMDYVIMDGMELRILSQSIEFYDAIGTLPTAPHATAVRTTSLLTLQQSKYTKISLCRSLVPGCVELQCFMGLRRYHTFNLAAMWEWCNISMGGSAHTVSLLK